MHESCLFTQFISKEKDGAIAEKARLVATTQWKDEEKADELLYIILNLSSTIVTQ